MSIKRKIGGLIAGWVMSMMVALVRHLIKRAFEKQQARAAAQASARATAYQQPNPTPSSRAPREVAQPFKKWAVTDTIYQGMDRDELVAAYGEPSYRSAPTSTREIWTYKRAKSNDNGMTVMLDSGIVTDWTEEAA